MGILHVQCEIYSSHLLPGVLFSWVEVMLHIGPVLKVPPMACVDVISFIPANSLKGSGYLVACQCERSQMKMARVLLFGAVFAVVASLCDVRLFPPLVFISMQMYKAHPCTKTLSSPRAEIVSFLTIISCIMSQIWMPRGPTVLPWILIPHSDRFISETPLQIVPLINRNDASIPTSLFPLPFPRQF